MPDASFAGFLGRSLDLLEREVPEALRVLCARMAPRTVAFDVDGEGVQIRFAPGTFVLGPPDGAPPVAVTTTRRAILDVVDGSTLADVVLDDRLRLLGAPSDLLAFHDGLLDYVHGAVRAPSFPALLAEFRAATRRIS